MTTTVTTTTTRDDPVEVAYAVLDTPVGAVLAATTTRGLVLLDYVGDEGADRPLEELSRRLSPRIREVPGRLEAVGRQLDAYFAGARRGFDLPIDHELVGGDFARRVLQETAGIPYGEVRTYAQVAEAAGNRRASRAAGNALGANPIPIVVPCHRVVRTGGALGGYTGGLDIKRHLLELEGARSG